MTLFMETTAISASRTSQQIAGLLAESGATAVLTEFGKDKKITGLCFRLDVKGQSVPFSLPIRSDSIFLLLQNRRKRPRNTSEQDDRDQAERIAWRQLLRWIEAQLAMIETGMVDAEEVFFPYIQIAPGVTLYQNAISGGRLALPPARGKHE